MNKLLILNPNLAKKNQEKFIFFVKIFWKIKNYKNFCEIIKPDVISIDYDVDPKIISQEINIPIQGGPDPKFLLGDKDQIKKEAIKYLDIFNHYPYIFNLGHGILPETDPLMVDYLVKLIKDY